MSWAATILAHFEQGFLFWVIVLIAVATGLKSGAPYWAWVIGITLAIAIAIFLARRRRTRRIRRAGVAAEANERLLGASHSDDA
jgi:membrane protein implicated in regulation of membrane protease activity